MNAGDEKEVNERKSSSKRNEALREQAFRDLMSKVEGRMLLWSWLEQLHVFTTSFHSDPLIMAFNEGQRSFGTTLLYLIQKGGPDGLVLMMKEANKLRIDENG